MINLLWPEHETMDAACYSGGNVVGAVFGTFFAIILLGIIGWWIYKRFYCRHNKGPKLVLEDDPESAKHEFAFDNPAFKGDAAKVSSSPLNINWTSPKSNTHDKRKPLDDSYAGMPAPRLISLRGSDFTGLGIECYGGLKEGIFVKKVAPQGPASGHINIGDRITSLTIDFRHIVQEDATTILSYASPYNVQLELVNGMGKIRSSGSSNREHTSPKMGRQSPLVHPLYRSSSSSDLNTIERNSRKKLFQNDDKDYPTLKMDKVSDQPAMPVVHKENEKKSPSLRQQFKELFEEAFQNKSSDKHHKMTSLEEQNSNKTDEITVMKESDKKEGSVSPKEKKGPKFGIRVFPPNLNDKLFGKSPSKVAEVEASKMKEDVKINIDEVDLNTAIVVVEKQMDSTFDRQGSINSSGIKRDQNGIPQELPSFMLNAANAVKDGRRSNNNSDTRKSKAKAPKPPPMTNIDLDASTDTMDTNLSFNDQSTNSMINITANNVNNANMELEDELDRITEKYLNQNKDKLNFSDNFSANSSFLNKSDDSIQLDKIEDMKDNIDDIEVVLREKDLSNTSTPKSGRKVNTNDALNEIELNASDVDLTHFGKRLELNSSDITVHQSNEVDDLCDETRRAASLGDLSKFEMKKSLSENDQMTTSTLERAQSLDITDNSLMPKQVLALANNLHKNTDVSINPIENNKSANMYQKMKTSPPAEDVNKTDQTKIFNYDTNIPDDIKVIRYPFGSLERPKSDVLKKLMSVEITVPTNQKSDIDSPPTEAPPAVPIVVATAQKDSKAPSIVMMTPALNNTPDLPISEPPKVAPRSNGFLLNGNNIEKLIKETEKDVQTNIYQRCDDYNKKIDNDKMEQNTKVLTVDTSSELEQPVSLTLINNTMDSHPLDHSQISPIFSSNNFGVNSIKISSMEFNVKPPQNKSISSTIIKNDSVQTPFAENYFVVKDNVVTISTDSQPSSIQFIDDMKLDFNLQVLDEIEKEQISMNDDTKLELQMELEKAVEEAVNAQELEMFEEMENAIDLEINNNVSSTKISRDGELKGSFSSETMYEQNGNGHDTQRDTPTSPSLSSSSSSSTTNLTSTKTMTLIQAPLTSSGNFLKQERKHVEKNFVPTNSEIKFTTAVYETTPTNNNKKETPPKPNEKRISHIDMIRQNFEKSAQQAEIPIPTARRSSIPLSLKTSPSKIPVSKSSFSKNSPPTNLKANNNSS